MRILVVSPVLPYPDRSGGAIRIAQLLRALAREHELTLLASKPARVDPEEARAALDPITLIPVSAGWVIGEGPTTAKRLWQARSLVSSRSALYWILAGPLLDALRRLDWQRFDIVQVEYSLLGLLPLPRSLPLVVDAHNLEYRVLERISQRSGWLRGLWVRRECQRVRREEITAWRQAALCLAVSRVDAEEMRRFAARRVAVIPNGVDARQTPFLPLDAAEPDHIVFVGNLRYWPNVDGVLWFVRKVWPAVRARIPSARFSIVGYDPPSALGMLSAIEGVRLVGTVPAVTPWLARASVVVVPLLAGSGTRLKILEAFAAGRPVVTTSLGLEGIDAEPGRHVIVADDAASFASAVVDLLASSQRRAALAEAARRLVEQLYDWDRIGEQLRAVYRAFVGEERIG
ncbi:glycosyltransferase [Thermomicrobium sp.]|uniref:glycosyltransferase n=1 Tax=Thermomicrobium sp. TaxID=1969469 RepID=UPI001B04DCCB|nr:glycosyltransferase [Thermomicrobium sp.]MBO9307342.1 glycosyltransferase [Thermomicrobium sp.]